MDILKEIQEIRLMPHNDSRDKRVYYLYKYLYYLFDSGQIDQTKFDVIKNLIGCKPSVLSVPIMDQYESLYLLTCLYDEVLNTAKEYNIMQSESPKINLDDYMAYAIDFLKYMDVYRLYKEIKDNNLLSFIKNNTNYAYRGTTYDINDGKSCIVVQNNNDIFTLITLIHEMGHAYAFHLSKDFTKRKPYSFESECLSITFEYLFMEFLRKNKLIDSGLLKKANIGRLSDLLVCMDIAHVFNNYTFDNNFKVKKEINIQHSDFKKLCILNSTHFYKPYFDYYTVKFKNNYYAYGFLFAMVMRERFKQNEKETREYLELFPSFAYDHLGYELIKTIASDEYISATNKYIEKTLTKLK